MDNAMVPFGPNARLMVTYNGVQGDYPDPVNFDGTDADIKQIATEAINTGYIPGIAADGNANLQDFVVDRFPATDELPPRLMLRPKTPFGPFTEEEKEAEGIKAIIALQAAAGIEEPEEKARAGWRGMQDWEKAKTLEVYKMVCGDKQ